MEVNDTIARRVRERRIALGWTQQTLAERVQRLIPTLYQPRVADIELGRRDVRAREVVALARVLNVPISWLLGVPDYEEWHPDK